jgi:hypothetical protein
LGCFEYPSQLSNRTAAGDHIVNDSNPVFRHGSGKGKGTGNVLLALAS